jgi:hypothetical protein
MMDAKTRTALDGSIDKWQGIVDGTTIDMGGENCPLCHMFYRPPNPCGGCPVRENTQLSGCLGTPYFSYTQSRSKAHARAMRDFLKGLLP